WAAIGRLLLQPKQPMLRRWLPIPTGKGTIPRHLLHDRSEGSDCLGEEVRSCVSGWNGSDRPSGTERFASPAKHGGNSFGLFVEFSTPRITTREHDQTDRPANGARSGSKHACQCSNFRLTAFGIVDDNQHSRLIA